jgi:hypothetical protein
MKITPEGVRLLAHSLQQASEALRDMAVFLSSLTVEPEQTELPTTGTYASIGFVPTHTYPPEVQAIAKTLVEQCLAAEKIEHSPEYLASKRACVEVAPEDPLTGHSLPITRQSLRALAEKLVAKGRLPDVKATLASFGVTTLSALKPENYAAAQADFIKNGAS